MARMNISLPFTEDSAIKKYLNTMLTQGHHDMVYEPCKPLRDKLQLEEKYKFGTHQELDLFCKNLIRDSMKQHVLFHLDYAHEWMLLKSFDRALWMKHYAKKTAQEYVPLFTSNNACDCPFKDPSTTQSLISK